MLLDGNRKIGPALDGRIVGNHHAELPRHHSNSRDDSTARDVFHVPGQSGKFQERCSRVAQRVHPIPGQEFLSVQVSFDGFGSASLLDLRNALVEFVYLLCGSFHRLQVGFGVDVHVAIHESGCGRIPESHCCLRINIVVCKNGIVLWKRTGMSSLFGERIFFTNARDTTRVPKQ